MPKLPKGSTKRKRESQSETPANIDPASSLLPPNEEELDPPIDNTQDGDDSTPPAKKSRKSNTLSEEQEECVIEFLRENPFLWHRSHRSYKDVKMKKAKWEFLATDMGLSYVHLKDWWTSMQSYYGKLIKKKSGQANRAPTDREK